jgi:uncharacterized pyridoxamine 5'-phosphate oxidase family protein
MNNTKQNFSLTLPERNLPVPSRPSMNLLSIVNPLGMIADGIKEYFHYKIQSQEIEMQIKQVQEQSRVMHAKIESDERIALAELEAQQNQLNNCMKLTFEDLHASSIERQEYINLISKITNAMIGPGLSDMERNIYQQSIKDFSLLLIENGRDSRRKFSSLLKNSESAYQLNGNRKNILLNN